MAYVYHDDFEWMNTTNANFFWRADEVSSDSVTSSTGASGMTGRYLQMAGNGFEKYIGFPFSSLTEGVFSAACFISAAGVTARNLITLHSGATINVAIRLNANGTINVLRNATVIGSASTGTLPIAKRFRIYVRFVIADSTGGEVIVSIDDGSGMTTFLTVTGVDTNESGGAVSRFRLYNQTTAAGNLLWDDVYIDSDKTWTQNDFTFQRLAPSADVSIVSTPSTGSTVYDLIDESPFTTTDYTTFATTGQDVFEFADLSTTPDEIKGLGVIYFANKTIGDPVEFRSRILSNATYSNGTTANLSATQLIYGDFHALDPNGNTTWSKASVDAAQLALERVS